MKPVVEELQSEGYPIELKLCDSNEKMIPHHEMPDWYASIDLYICMSKIEGTPNPILECMACGLLALARGFVTPEKLSAAGPPGGPSACAFWTAPSGFSPPPTPSTKYRMGKMPENLHLRAKYSLENISKAFSNFLEIDECFQDSDFVTRQCLAPAWASLPPLRPANPALLPAGSQSTYRRLFSLS